MRAKKITRRTAVYWRGMGASRFVQSGTPRMHRHARACTCTWLLRGLLYRCWCKRRYQVTVGFVAYEDAIGLYDTVPRLQLCLACEHMIAGRPVPAKLEDVGAGSGLKQIVSHEENLPNTQIFNTSQQPSNPATQQPSNYTPQIRRIRTHSEDSRAAWLPPTTRTHSEDSRAAWLPPTTVHTARTHVQHGCPQQQGLTCSMAAPNNRYTQRTHVQHGCPQQQQQQQGLTCSMAAPNNSPHEKACGNEEMRK